MEALDGLNLERYDFVSRFVDVALSTERNRSLKTISGHILGSDTLIHLVKDFLHQVQKV